MMTTSYTKLTLIDLKNSITNRKDLSIPAEEIIGECIIIPKEK